MILGGLLLSVWGGFKRRLATSVTGTFGVFIFWLLIGLASPPCLSAGCRSLRTLWSGGHSLPRQWRGCYDPSGRRARDAWAVRCRLYERARRRGASGDGGRRPCSRHCWRAAFSVRWGLGCAARGLHPSLSTVAPIHRRFVARGRYGGTRARPGRNSRWRNKRTRTAHMQEKRMTESRNWKLPFFTIWTGQAISLLGDQTGPVRPDLVADHHHRLGSSVGHGYNRRHLPTILLGPFAGTLEVDRWPRKWVLILSDSSIAVFTALLGLLFWLGVAQPWPVFVILFLRSLGDAFQNPAMQDHDAHDGAQESSSHVSPA